MGDIEDHRLSPEIVPRAKGDRETYLANGSSSDIGDSIEGFGRLEARVRDLHLIEGGDGDDVEARSSIHEGLGDFHIVDDATLVTWVARSFTDSRREVMNTMNGEEHGRKSEIQTHTTLTPVALVGPIHQLNRIHKEKTQR